MIHDKRRRCIASRRRHVLRVFLLVILVGTACGESPPQIGSGMKNSDAEMESDDLELEEDVGVSGADENTHDDENELTVTQSQYVYHDRL